MVSPPPLAYVVTRKRVKNLRLTVKAPSGEVRVTAPLYASDRTIASFVESKREWVLKHQARVAHLPAPMQPGPAATAARRQLKRDIPPLLAEWAPRIGVEIPDYTVRRMTTRWGTCNTVARRVTFNLELARREPELLEYVVVHELAHLIERGHNERFYAVMTAALPDWKLRRKALNTGGIAPDVAERAPLVSQ